MYETHFGLSARPFPEAPKPDYYFPAQVHEQSRESIVRCLTRGSGPALLLGGAGTGKSMLCERVAFELQSRFPVVNLNWGHPQSCRGLLQSILYKLELPYRNLDEGELRLTLIDHITRSANCPHGMVLIVDEAHVLSPDLLNEIRTLTNVVAGGEPRVRLVLAGQMSLEETLSLATMQSLQQRIAVRCAVSGFRREETKAFVRQAVARCGGVPNGILLSDAYNVIHELTEGIPRLVSQLCDHALIMASIDAEPQVSAELVHEAWADLQQLPIVLDTYRLPHLASDDGGVLEFGTLDPEECETSIPIRPSIRIENERPTPLVPPTGDAPAWDVEDDNSEVIEELTAESIPEIPPTSSELRPLGEADPSETYQPEVNVPVDLFGSEFGEVEPVDDRYTCQSSGVFSSRHDCGKVPSPSPGEGFAESNSLTSSVCPTPKSATFTPDDVTIAGVPPALDSCHRLTWSVVSTDESAATYEKPEENSGLENKGSCRRLFSKLEAKRARNPS